MPKAAIFIDGGYLAAILRRYFSGTRINFTRLSDKLALPDQRFRTYYYYCMPYQSNPPTAEERTRYEDAMRFFSALKMSPRFEVKHGRLKKGLDVMGNSTFEQKGVDVLLSVDLVRLAATNQIDRAVLVTGDSDFVPAIRVAKESINVSLYYYRGTVHNELLQICDDRVEIQSGFFDDVREQ
jgi:uncharacterized LabA/DUF88 family protein